MTGLDSLTAIQLQSGVQHLHALGPRAVTEFLTAIASGTTTCRRLSSASPNTGTRLRMRRCASSAPIRSRSGAAGSAGMKGVCDLRANAARLKAEISIVCIIGETLVLKPNGRLHVALCPFRGDRTPSFTVYLDHFHCFGCSVHGDVFDRLMQAHCMTFPEAVRHLSRGTQYKPAAVVNRPAVEGARLHHG